MIVLFTEKFYTMMNSAKPVNIFCRILLVPFVTGIIFLNGCSMQTGSFVPVSVTKPFEQSPTDSLLADAKQAMKMGQFDQAEIYIERALRISPRDAAIWHAMGQVKYGQNNHGQSVQFCLKSNSLAGRDTHLIRQNWKLIEQSYRRMGQIEKADEVRYRYL